jgi:hypothetical protein
MILILDMPEFHNHYSTYNHFSEASKPYQTIILDVATRVSLIDGILTSILLMLIYLSTLF